MSYAHIIDPLHRAVHSLAVGGGRIHERLFKAIVELSPIDEAEVPTEVRERLLMIQSLELFEHPYSKEGSLQHRVAALPEGVAMAYANELLELYLRARLDWNEPRRGSG